MTQKHRCAFRAALALSVLLLVFSPMGSAQQTTAVSTSNGVPNAGTTKLSAPARETLSRQPWEWGPFFNGGFGVGSDRSGYRVLSAGLHAGKLLTGPAGPRFLRGQFEYAAELMPWWQGYAPAFDRYTVTQISADEFAVAGPYRTGGAYNGISVTPIILRWNLVGGRRVLPFVQGAGGMVWTNHKFPPVGPYPPPGHQATSVWNFTPQFGVGLQYFLKPNRSITFGANAVHISNASLGDSNPGVNATVQFQVGYTWWK